MLGPPKTIPIQWFLFNTTTFFVSQMKKIMKFIMAAMITPSCNYLGRVVTKHTVAFSYFSVPRKKDKH